MALPKLTDKVQRINYRKIFESRESWTKVIGVHDHKYKKLRPNSIDVLIDEIELKLMAGHYPTSDAFNLAQS